MTLGGAQAALEAELPQKGKSRMVGVASEEVTKQVGGTVEARRPQDEWMAAWAAAKR